MTVFPELVELSAGGLKVTFDGGNADPDDDVLYIAPEGVEGWYDMPDDKTTMTERGQGDGAHDIPVADILYSARVVTLHFIVGAHDRQGVVRLLTQIRRVCAHSKVRFLLRDAGHDCYVTGRAILKSSGRYGDDGWLEDNTLTVTCERPEILSDSTLLFQLYPASTGDNGLRYGDSAAGLQYPLTYGVAATDARNVGTIRNGGTSRAYPVFTVNGSFASVQLMFPGTTLGLDYSQPVGGTPLVLDCRSRTATMGGLDVSRNLRSRGFPTVPANGSLSVNLQSSGSGWITVESHDTYM